LFFFHDEELRDKATKANGEYYGDCRKVARAMYENTQKELRNKFPDGSVLLYRGKENVYAKDSKGNIFNYNGNSSESWSVSVTMALSFGDVVCAKIPVSRILCTAKTGLGCLSEFEFIVLSNKSDTPDTVYVL
jgi:hypothetical protein